MSMGDEDAKQVIWPLFPVCKGLPTGGHQQVLRLTVGERGGEQSALKSCQFTDTVL